MPTDKKIEIFNDEGQRIGYEPLLSEAEVAEYYKVRRIRDPNDKNLYLYPPERLNPIVIQAHKDGKEFTGDMIMPGTEQLKPSDNDPIAAPELLTQEPSESETATDGAVSSQPSGNSDKLLNDEKKSELEEIELSVLESFPDHKFKTYEGQRLQDMVDSIRQFGILMPLIVWKNEERYIIISGHNRHKAGLLAGLTKAPAIIKQDINEEQAQLIVGETNLRQRSFADMTHSERAFCLAEHYKLMKKQGVRNDIIEMMDDPELINDPDFSQNYHTNLQEKNPDFSDDEAENSTCAKNVHKLKSREEIGKDYGLNHAIVSKYIRIAEMHESLLKLLDEKHIKFSAAYQLSFITDDISQKNIAEVVAGGQKVNEEDAKKLRAFYEKKKSLEVSDVLKILSKPQKQEKPIQLKSSFLSDYFTNGESKQEILDIIAAALDDYFAKKGSDTV